jgi:hypothetical protein
MKNLNKDTFEEEDLNEKGIYYFERVIDCRYNLDRDQ